MSGPNVSRATRAAAVVLGLGFALPIYLGSIVFRSIPLPAGRLGRAPGP